MSGRIPRDQTIKDLKVEDIHFTNNLRVKLNVSGDKLIYTDVEGIERNVSHDLSVNLNAVNNVSLGPRSGSSLVSGTNNCFFGFNANAGS